jgi:hypothetical protein
MSATAFTTATTFALRQTACLVHSALASWVWAGETEGRLLHHGVHVATLTRS